MIVSYVASVVLRSERKSRRSFARPGCSDKGSGLNGSVASATACRRRGGGVPRTGMRAVSRGKPCAEER